jgi:hypothetical protein
LTFKTFVPSGNSLISILSFDIDGVLRPLALYLERKRSMNKLKYTNQVIVAFGIALNLVRNSISVFNRNLKQRTIGYLETSDKVPFGTLARTAKYDR